jgi:two-component system, chemotaxis family, CheB/CheR fusion protein
VSSARPDDDPAPDPAPEPDAAAADVADLQGLLDLVWRERGVDLTAYKAPGLNRRILRRMDRVGAPDVAGYTALLRDDADEVNALLDSVFINVTAFYRDRETWEHLAEKVIPDLLGRLPFDAPLRMWSAGCASGEEAYSLAIVLCEALGTTTFRERVKIYATDIDPGALETARLGRYPNERFDDLPGHLREHYFEGGPDSFRFRSDLRRALVFGRHDLLADAPISRINLLLCRNTLMYFTPDAQRRILDRFHFSTSGGDGLLVLGRAEALASRTDKFAPVDLTHRVYAPVPGVWTHASAPQASRPRDLEDSPVMSIRDAGFDTSALPQLLVDGGGNLAAANQAARSTFSIAESDLGRPLQDLEISYRPFEIRSRIELASAERRQVLERNVDAVIDGHGCMYDIAVTPLLVKNGDLLGVSVTYTDVTKYRAATDELMTVRNRLDTAYEELQSAVEELETTNEELQSTNEELETTNEELQSTNEELETMNEELHSTNDELHRVNIELHERSDALDSANLALEAILTSLQSAVIVLSSDLRVEVWNSHAEELWGIRSDEAVGEHLMKLDIGLPLDLLRQPMRETLSDPDHDGDLMVDAINRRGRQVRCRVRVTSLRRRDGTPTGLVLLLDSENGSAGPHN